MTMVMEKLNTTERGNRPGTHTCLDMSITDLENCLEGVNSSNVGRDFSGGTTRIANSELNITTCS